LLALPPSDLGLVWTGPRHILNPDPSPLIRPVRVVVRQYLYLIKHCTAILTVDLGNYNRPNIFDRCSGTFPGTFHFFLTSVLKKQDCGKNDNNQR
jgi:hypothetical protein